MLKLKIRNFKIDDLSLKLIDLNGKQISEKKIDEEETNIPVEYLIPGNYFLIITQNDRPVKTFKIVKN